MPATLADISIRGILNPLDRVSERHAPAYAINARSTNTFHCQPEAAQIHQLPLRYVSNPDISRFGPFLSNSSLDSSPSLDSSDHKFAVIIGIDYMTKKVSLNGHCRDARNFRRYLIEYKDFSPENIILLTDDQNSKTSTPNKRNILLAMHWLAKAGKNHDNVIFYYSGFAGPTRKQQLLQSSASPSYTARQDINSNTEAENIYPSDCREVGPINHSEMQRILIDALAPRAKLTLIIDSAESSHAIR